MERLRDHLGIDRWLVFGHSWGCTLGLVYAETHPERVSGLLLAGVTMTRRSEIDWLSRGLAPLFPVEFDRFRRGAPEGIADGDLLAAYARLLGDADPAVREKAARDFHDWDAATATTDPGAPARVPREAHLEIARARICTHYFRHDGFLEDGQILRNIGRIAAIPGIMVHGRLDLEAPLTTAWELDRAWPAAELVIVPKAGHDTAEDNMAAAIADAAARLA